MDYQKSINPICASAIEESKIDEQILEDIENIKLSVVRSDPTQTTATDACEKIVSDLDKIEEITSNQSVVVKSDLAKGKSPQTSRVNDLRQFQKTRSFSAVEDTPDKKVATEHLSAIPDFPLRDVSHSRSEQLKTQPKQQRLSIESGDSSGVARRPQSDITKGEIKSEDCSETPKSFDGDTLIMQFDYYSNDQPMSLQNESQYSGVSSGRSGVSDLRKSGRDLTELSSDITHDELNQIKANRINSRPRLDSSSSSLCNPPIYSFMLVSISFFITSYSVQIPPHVST